MEEAERYFLRRRQQFEAALEGTPLTHSRPRPLSAFASQGTGTDTRQAVQIHSKIQCVGPETFPSPFREDVAKGSPVAQEFAKQFARA